MTKATRDAFIYKILTLDQWETFQTEFNFKGSPVDLSDGYIHMSCVPELKETMDKYYADQDEVALLKVEAAAIEANLKYEISRGGAEFPHLFADMPIEAVKHVWLVSSEDGVYSLPKDVTAN